MIKNILIDLDGTLTDPKVGITTSARYGLEKIGHPISDEINIDWIIGPPLKASLAKIFSVHDKFHRTLILSGFCLLKIAKISLNSSFFPKPIKR